MEWLRRQTLLNPDFIARAKFSRREFGLLAAATAVSLVFLSETIQDKVDGLIDFSKDLRERPDTRFYYHNAANNPNLLKKALQGSAPGILSTIIS